MKTVIPFNDFAAHVRGLRPEIEAAMARVLDRGWFILGPEVNAFEAELAAFFGVPDAVAVANGTDALQLALEAQGIGPGAEVITSPLTAAFTALAIIKAGAVPIFADVDPDTLTLTADTARAVLSPKTRAIVPVHLYGHPADLDPLFALAQEKKWVVLEDACQAHGALYKGRPVGAESGLAALSFYPTKNLGAFGDGGAILVGDAEVARVLRQLRNGGQSDRYHHVRTGINSRLDELHAAVLRSKLTHLSHWIDRRRHLASLYHQALATLPLRLPVERSYARAAYHLFVIRHPERDAIAAGLRQHGIETLIHYPIPLHLQPAFARLGGRPGQFPVAESAAQQILSLPLYPELSEERVLQVTDALREILAALREPNTSSRS
ncbi:MAG: DegT/DnrJ/EryC1/StrS family aminotransferase [Vicinamibacteria bacterium]|nr:DegT/DnrJ/EryC1/StrS family aminotransferase [Vicinamibacteria bacterium]